MLDALWIFLGGGVGSVGRWALSGWIGKSFGETFPWGTLIVNVSGSFVIGLFAGLVGPEGRWLPSASFRKFFVFGICGGYTTFSSFSLQTLTLAEEGQWFKAGMNAFLSLALCLLAVWIGHALALQFSSIKAR
jgi:CrcB protein